MRRTLIALAAAGLLTSGVAAAGSTSVQVYHDGNAAIVPVQYVDQNGNRWYDRSATIDQREAQIRHRIEHGVSDGRITNREARRLYRELASIEATEHSYKSDGRLTYRETAELNRRLDNLASNVRVQMRDDDRRYSYNYNR